MKKTLVYLGLFSLLLAGCGEKKENKGTNPSGADFSTQLPILKEKKDTSIETLTVLANAPVVVVNPTPPADDSQRGHKMHAANNGVAEKDEAGNIKEYFRYYDVPANWTINAENTEDETIAAVYDVKEGANQFMVQLYNLNAFNKSPLEEGRNMTPEELDARMAETNHSFVERTIVTIHGQEWQVGRQILKNQNMGRFIFYRMESTGAYDDSVVVGSVYYTLKTETDPERKALQVVIGQLKDVLYTISKK